MHLAVLWPSLLWFWLWNGCHGCALAWRWHRGELADHEFLLLAAQHSPQLLHRTFFPTNTQDELERHQRALFETLQSSLQPLQVGTAARLLDALDGFPDAALVFRWKSQLLRWAIVEEAEALTTALLIRGMHREMPRILASTDLLERLAVLGKVTVLRRLQPWETSTAVFHSMNFAMISAAAHGQREAAVYLLSRLPIERFPHARCHALATATAHGHCDIARLLAGAVMDRLESGVAPSVHRVPRKPVNYAECDPAPKACKSIVVPRQPVPETPEKSRSPPLEIRPKNPLRQSQIGKVGSFPATASEGDRSKGKGSNRVHEKRSGKVESNETLMESIRQGLKLRPVQPGAVPSGKPMKSETKDISAALKEALAKRRMTLQPSPTPQD